MRKRVIVIFVLLSGLTLLCTAVLRFCSSMSGMYIQEAIYNTLHPNSPSFPPNVEPLLPKGTSLKAHTKYADLEIRALDDQTREYKWRNYGEQNWNVETIRLKAEQSGRNLFYPGNRCEDISTLIGLKHNIISCEGDRNITSSELLKFWLENYGITDGAIYTKTGFLVGCKPGLTDRFLVVQLKLDGKTPNNLPGAADSDILLPRN